MVVIRLFIAALMSWCRSTELRGLFDCTAVALRIGLSLLLEVLGAVADGTDGEYEYRPGQHSRAPSERWVPAC